PTRNGRPPGPGQAGGPPHVSGGGDRERVAGHDLPGHSVAPLPHHGHARVALLPRPPPAGAEVGAGTDAVAQPGLIVWITGLAGDLLRLTEKPGAPAPEEAAPEGRLADRFEPEAADGVRSVSGFERLEETA